MQSLLALFRQWLRRMRGRHSRRRTGIETYEPRLVLSATTLPIEVVSNDTLDLAQLIERAEDQVFATQDGSIGNSPTGDTDVDWYSFLLEQSAEVSLDTDNNDILLSLFNHSPFSFDDPHNPLGHRLLDRGSQVQATLAAGTYYVAVSGLGNDVFHPFLAGSGLPGETGDYALSIQTQALSFASDLSILTVMPGTDAALETAAPTIRLQVAGELDPATLIPDDTFSVTFSPNPDFTDGDELPVPIGTFGYNAFAHEIHFSSLEPLAPGHYRISLSGSQLDHFSVLADVNGVPLGADLDHLHGVDFTSTFEVLGIEGHSASDDSNDVVAGATDLGTLATSDVTHVSGFIGDDPYYAVSTDSLLNPANDVDLYQVTVTGSGTFVLAAEVFAGRIGSPLDSAVSLYRRNSETGAIEFVAGNNNTANPTQTENGFVPLYTDSAIFAGVTAGEYFIAVSSGFNVASLEEGLLPGSDGQFNPEVAHSGTSGINVGNYVLTLQLVPDNDAPVIESASIVAGSQLTSAPTVISVTFSESMNLQQLAFSAFSQASEATVAAISIVSETGERFFPRLMNYDIGTGRAEFLMLDALPSGSYQWHFSSALGLTDLAGHALQANDPSGDFVISFEVDAEPWGVDGDPLRRIVEEREADADQTQDLGVLFPHELQSIVSVVREATRRGNTRDTADVLRFTVLQSQDYVFALVGDDLPTDTLLWLTDAEAVPLSYAQSDNGRVLTARLEPGTYEIHLHGWNANEARNIGYEVRFGLIASGDNPPPLSTGAGPALRLRLAGTSSQSSNGNQLNLAGTTQPGNNAPLVANTDANRIVVTRSNSALNSFGAPLLGGVGSLDGFSPGASRQLSLHLPNDAGSPRQVVLNDVTETSEDTEDAATSDSTTPPPATRPLKKSVRSTPTQTAPTANEESQPTQKPKSEPTVQETESDPNAALVAPWLSVLAAAYVVQQRNTRRRQRSE